MDRTSTLMQQCRYVTKLFTLSLYTSEVPSQTMPEINEVPHPWHCQAGLLALSSQSCVYR
jgi:hypothetical protein